MVTIDLNIEHQWDDLIRRVEEQGEVLRIVRGDKEIAIVSPAGARDGERDLEAWSQRGLRQLAEAFPPNEFADWEQGNGTR